MAESGGLLEPPKPKIYFSNKEKLKETEQKEKGGGREGFLPVTNKLKQFYFKIIYDLLKVFKHFFF